MRVMTRRICQKKSRNIPKTSSRTSWLSSKTTSSGKSKPQSSTTSITYTKTLRGWRSSRKSWNTYQLTAKCRTQNNSKMCFHSAISNNFLLSSWKMRLRTGLSVPTSCNWRKCIYWPYLLWLRLLNPRKGSDSLSNNGDYYDNNTKHTTTYFSIYTLNIIDYCKYL